MIYNIGQLLSEIECCRINLSILASVYHCQSITKCCSCQFETARRQYIRKFKAVNGLTAAFQLFDIVKDVVLLFLFVGVLKAVAYANN